MRPIVERWSAERERCRGLHEEGLCRAEGGAVEGLVELIEEERRILQAYTDVKCAPFLTQPDTHMYEHTPDVYGVSNYVKNMLLAVVSVHAELFLHAKHFNDQVTVRGYGGFMQIIVGDGVCGESVRGTLVRVCANVGR